MIRVSSKPSSSWKAGRINGRTSPRVCSAILSAVSTASASGVHEMAMNGMCENALPSDVAVFAAYRTSVTVTPVAMACRQSTRVPTCIHSTWCLLCCHTRKKTARSTLWPCWSGRRACLCGSGTGGNDLLHHHTSMRTVSGPPIRSLCDTLLASNKKMCHRACCRDAQLVSSSPYSTVFHSLRKKMGSD